MSKADDIVHFKQCLRAVAYGPFFKDWEFGTLLHIDRDQLRQFCDAFDRSPQLTPETALTIETCVRGLLHNNMEKTRAWSDWISAPAEELHRALNRLHAKTAIANKFKFNPLSQTWHGRTIDGLYCEIPGTAEEINERGIALIAAASTMAKSIEHNANAYLRQFCELQRGAPGSLGILQASTSCRSLFAFLRFEDDFWGNWWVEFLKDRNGSYSPIAFGRTGVASYEAGEPIRVIHRSPDPGP